MSEKKKFIYFPSFSSKESFLKKDDFKMGNLETIRFYDDRYPEKFRHKFFLLTAAAFYKKKEHTRTALGMEDTFILGDSGGFQIASGAIKYLNESTAQKELIRDQLFNWLENNSDLAMNLDIPPKITLAGRFDEALDLSVANFKYFENKQSGKTKFLNVLQMGNGLKTYDKWYNATKDFEFKGWGIGGTTKQYFNSIYVMAMFLKNKELEKKNIEYLHFLGTTSPFNFLVYAAFQKGLNEYFPHCTVTTDSSTPLMQGVYGNWYHSLNYNKLNWKQLYFGNKGRTNYIDDERLPCVLGCPVCKNITFGDVANYKKLSEYMVYVGWHNLAVFIKGLDEVSDLIHSHRPGVTPEEIAAGGVLEIMFPKDILTMLRSIHDMFLYPDKAIEIFEKNKKLYEKVSNNMTLSTDKSIVHSALFGTDDEIFEEDPELEAEIANMKLYETE